MIFEADTCESIMGQTSLVSDWARWESVDQPLTRVGYGAHLGLAGSKSRATSTFIGTKDRLELAQHGTLLGFHIMNPKPLHIFGLYKIFLNT